MKAGNSQERNGNRRRELTRARLGKSPDFERDGACRVDHGEQQDSDGNDAFLHRQTTVFE